MAGPGRAGGRRVLSLIWLFCAVAPFARAIDAGTAAGTLQAGGRVVTLRHAFAHLQHLSGEAREMRIALLDQPIAQADLAGPDPPVLHSSYAAAGLLLRFDPRGKESLLLTSLGMAAKTGGVVIWRRWAINPQRVDGIIELHPQIGGEAGPLRSLGLLRFSAPLFSGR